MRSCLHTGTGYQGVRIVFTRKCVESKRDALGTCERMIASDSQRSRVGLVVECVWMTVFFPGLVIEKHEFGFASEEI